MPYKNKWGDVSPKTDRVACAEKLTRGQMRPDGWRYWSRETALGRQVWVSQEDYERLTELTPRKPRLALPKVTYVCDAHVRTMKAHLKKLASRRSNMPPEIAESRRAKARAREREYKRTKPLNRLASKVRSRLAMAFKKGGFSRPCKTQEMLGCTWPFYRAYIEVRFQPGMTWENYGSVWHLDHAIPLSSAKTPKEMARLCKFTNTQPMFSWDNISKNDKTVVQQCLNF